MTIDGYQITPASFYKPLALDLPIGFVDCYGEPPLAAQHRDVGPLVGGAVQGIHESFQAASDYYKQQLVGFKGLVNEAMIPGLRPFFDEVRRVLGPIFGPILPFVAFGNLYASCPEYRVEDGSDPNPMRGPRPLVFSLEYARKNPDAVDEIGAAMVADLIGRGFPVHGKGLLTKLPKGLQERNEKLMLEAIRRAEEAKADEIPVLS